MIRIATIEITKYVRAFVIIIILYGLFMTIVVSRFDAKNFFLDGTFDFQTFKVVNSSFTTLIASLVPFTIILNVCNEFKNGYALKLISNGLSRSSYCSFKFILAGTLAITSMLLYLLIISFFLSIQRTTYFDMAICISSLIQTVIFSLFFSSIAVSVSLLTRTWQSALLVYYGYVIVENIIILGFAESVSWVKYLPFHLVNSIFELKAIPESFKDFLLPACIIIPFCLVIVWCAYHFFKKADL